MRVVCMGFMDPGDWSTRERGEFETFVDACFEFDAELKRLGIFLSGIPLAGPSEAFTMRHAGSGVIVHDGPFIETKEQLGGLSILEVRDLEHARSVFSEHPALAWGAIFELRRVESYDEILSASEGRRRAKAAQA